MDDQETRRIQQKESVYRKLYSAILQKHRGVLQEHDDDNTSNVLFEDEQQMLNKIFYSEVKNLLFGVGVTAVTLVSLRTGSRYALSKMFGDAKAQAFREAETQAKLVGTEGVQNRVAFFVEGMFSLCAGYRFYEYASHHSEAGWEAVSEIPLCRGRSRISEALCPEWIETTNTQIPPQFWQALDNGKLRDERTWNTIRTFSINCERRQFAEDRLQREGSISTDLPVALPECVSPRGDP